MARRAGRRAAGIATVAGAVASALAMTACGGGGSSSNTATSGKTATSTSASTTPPTSASISTSSTSESTPTPQATSTKRSGSTVTSTARFGRLSLTVVFPRSQPRVHRGWPIVVTARADGAPASSGEVSYDFLFHGAKVSHQPGGAIRNGVYRDALDFPPAAVGLPIVLRVLVSAGGLAGYVDRPVVVER